MDRGNPRIQKINPLLYWFPAGMYLPGLVIIGQLPYTKGALKDEWISAGDQVFHPGYDCE